MSIKPPKPVCTLNQAFAPDLSKSISWSLFMEHAARALTCEISNPLDRAGVDISHSRRGLSRPQVGFVHCCGLINMEGMLHTNTQSPKNRRTQKIRASKTSRSFETHYLLIFKGFNHSPKTLNVLFTLHVSQSHQNSSRTFRNVILYWKKNTEVLWSLFLLLPNIVLPVSSIVSTLLVTQFSIQSYTHTPIPSTNLLQCVCSLDLHQKCWQPVI